MALLRCILGVVVLLSVSVSVCFAAADQGLEDALEASQNQQEADSDQDQDLNSDLDLDLEPDVAEEQDGDLAASSVKDDDSDEDEDSEEDQDSREKDQDSGVDQDSGQKDQDFDENQDSGEDQDLGEKDQDSIEDQDSGENQGSVKDQDFGEEDQDSGEEEQDSGEKDQDSVEDQDSGEDEDSGENQNSGEDQDSGEDQESIKDQDSGEEDSLSVSERLEQANEHLDGDEDSVIKDGDIAIPRPHHVQKRNADRCVRKGCRWIRSCNGKVYVPYVIGNHYSSSQLQTIRQAFTSFAQRTCIRFVRRRKQRDYLYIHSSAGCWSYIGRRGRRQKLSLQKNGCVYQGIIQHELLHALGFHHEHKRSDRDRYIRVLWGNIRKKSVHNFRKTSTLNLGTPYDYGSIMHYSRKAFSKNGKPTLVSRRCNVTFGTAKKMSTWDIRRVNRLYCGTR